MQEQGGATVDLLLEQYLAEDDVSRASRLLESLSVEVRSIVSRVLLYRGGRKPGDRERAEDACQDCLLSILRKIQRMKSGSPEAPVKCLGAYAAAAAQNSFRGSLRKEYQEPHIETSPHDGEDAMDRVADPGPETESDIVNQLHREQLLNEAWQVIRKLPLRQRFALLLALPPDAFLAYRLMVGQAAVCECLHLEPAEIDALPSRLPVPDSSLAEAMGIRRQQVINLRQAARQRLARSIARK